MKLPNFQLPSQKEWAAGVGGLLAWAVCWGLSFAGINVPIDAQPGIVIVCSMIVAKLTPPSEVDVVRHLNDTIAQAGTLLGKLTPASDSPNPPSTAAATLAAKVN